MGFENVGKVWTPDSLAEYLDGKARPAWIKKITLHHTGTPSLAQRPHGFTGQHIKNIEHFYRVKKGWSSGPHLFIDDNEAFGMCSFRKKGVHAVGFNKNAIGIEVLGHYDVGKDDPKFGRGLSCWTTTAATVRVLLDWLKLKPSANTIVFHREDGHTSKSCPGTAISKQWFLGLIPSSVDGPAVEPILFEKPDVGIPWEKWHFAGENWCVPLLDFLVAQGTPQDEVVASLKSSDGRFFYANELIEGAFFARKNSGPVPDQVTWAPALELLEITSRNLEPVSPVASTIPSEGPTIHFGRILAGCRYRTSDGDYLLSSAAADATLADTKTSLFEEARELENHFAVIRGARKGAAIMDCSIIEVVPPIASGVFSRLVDADNAIRDRVLSIAREARDEIVGVLPDVPDAIKPLKTSSSGPLPLCVVDIGHSKSRPGACGILKGKTLCEFAFNSEIADLIQKKVTNAEVIVVSRPDNADGYARLPGIINEHQPNFAVSLHCNAADSSVSGTEVLHWHTSETGEELASILQDKLVKTLGLKNRGLKPRTAIQRGGSLLKQVKAPIVIGEPFFISNPSDLAKSGTMKGKKALAEAYAAAIDEYAATFSNPEKAVTSTKVVGSHLAPSAKNFKFKTANLTKEQFFSSNDDELMRLIDAVNARLAEEYTSGFSPVTRADVWLLTYCECGLRNGKVDPDHRHSEGERGLLPLPSNLDDWIGEDVPTWDRVMPVTRNLEYFYLYLGQLKNKAMANVEGRALYRDLFQIGQIASDPVRQAKLLAGVVHGYFYSGTYSDRRVPFEHLLRGFIQDEPLPELMRPTKYRHAGTPVITSREKNIKAALKLV